MCFFFFFLLFFFCLFFFWFVLLLFFVVVVVVVFVFMHPKVGLFLSFYAPKHLKNMRQFAKGRYSESYL